MSKPKYIYFHLRSRGELPRLVAAFGGLEYEEERVTFSEWPELKSKTPYGQLPVLIVDGKWYAQKLAISLYFARQVGLYPTSDAPLEILKYDHALQFTEEILEDVNIGRIDNDRFSRPEKQQKLIDEILPRKVPNLEKLLKENGTGCFVGNKLTIVDLSAFDVTEHVIDLLGWSYLDSLPLLKAHYEQVKNIESIKKYLASRPPGEFNF